KSENESGNPIAGSMPPKSVESMTLRVPFTAVPEAAVGDSVVVSCPVAPAASSTGVAAAPPLMSLAEDCSSKNPAWFVVFVTLTETGNWGPAGMGVGVEFGRPFSGKGPAWLVRTAPG